MKIFKTTFGFNLEVSVNNIILNFEFREEDNQCSSDLCTTENWLLCVITRNGTPVLGKEYFNDNE